MRYSDREYLAKFLIDNEFEGLASQEDWEELIAPELLASDDAMDAGDGYWEDTLDRG